MQDQTPDVDISSKQIVNTPVSFCWIPRRQTDVCPLTPEPTAPFLATECLQPCAREDYFPRFPSGRTGSAYPLSILVPIRRAGAEPDNRSSCSEDSIRRNLYPFIKRWPTPSQTAETLIVRRDGNDALFLNELRFRKNTALNLRIPLENMQTPAVQAVLGQKGIFEGVDYRGIHVIADVRPVPDSPWFLVTRMDTSEIYTPLREKLWEILILIGALLICAGAGTGFVETSARALRNMGSLRRCVIARNSSALCSSSLTVLRKPIYAPDNGCV
jgi:hypothetical protein